MTTNDMIDICDDLSRMIEKAKGTSIERDLLRAKIKLLLTIEARTSRRRVAEEIYQMIDHCR